MDERILSDDHLVVELPWVEVTCVYGRGRPDPNLARFSFHIGGEKRAAEITVELTRSELQQIADAFARFSRGDFRASSTVEHERRQMREQTPEGGGEGWSAVVSAQA